MCIYVHPSILSDEVQTDIISAAGFLITEQDNAKCIILHESGGDTNSSYENTNGTIDRGVFQINSNWASWDDPVTNKHGFFDLSKAFDPYYNAQYAYYIWEKWGWQRWATASKCNL